MAFCLLGTRPLSEPILMALCLLGTKLLSELMAFCLLGTNRNQNQF